MACHTPSVGWRRARAPHRRPRRGARRPPGRRARRAPGRPVRARLGGGAVHRHAPMAQPAAGAAPGRRAGAADGISANIDLPFPAELRQLVLDADCPVRVAARRPAPIPGRSTGWSGRCSRCSTTAGSTTRCSRRWPSVPPGATLLGRARRLADLLDRYAVHRPGCIHGVGRRPRPRRRPASGSPTTCGGSRTCSAVVRAQIGQPSPPERLPGLLAAIVDGTLDARASLPAVALFGLSTLPPDLGPLLEALAVDAEVRRARAGAVARAHPRRRLPAAAGVAPAGDDDAARSWSFPRQIDPTVEVARHPLLRSWGQPTRELAAQLGVAGRRRRRSRRRAPSRRSAGRHLLGPAAARHLGPTRRPTAAIALGRRRSEHPGALVLGPDPPGRGAPRRDLRAAGRRPHAHRGRHRGDEPAARAASCPCVEAVFGPSAGDARPRRPARRPARRCATASPIARCASATRCSARSTRVLALVLPGRFTASAVTEVLSLDPVRRRFGLVARRPRRCSTGGSATTNIRWGLDGPHRGRWGLPGRLRGQHLAGRASTSC